VWVGLDPWWLAPLPPFDKKKLQIPGGVVVCFGYAKAP